MSRTRRLIHAASLIAALGAPVTGAIAQDASEKEGAAESAPASPLQGPKVIDERAPGTDSRFSMGMERARESERPIPLRVYEQELRKLAAATMDESLRLSTEQQQAIRKIIQEHRRALRAFYAEHREEIAAIRAESAAGAGTDGATDGATDKAPPRRGAPGAERDKPRDAQETNDRSRDTTRDRARDNSARDRQPGARRGPAGARDARAMSPEARAKMQALRAKGPQESAAISQIWNLLNPEQRAHLTARFESIREATMRQREARKRQGQAENSTDRPNVDSVTPEQRRARRSGQRSRDGAPPKRDD